MTSPRETVLCQYRYDPLDRLASHALPDTPERQRFYCKSRLATEIQGAMRYSIVQYGDQLLAQQRSEGDQLDATLLATDQQRSVLQVLKADRPAQPIGYSPYGLRSIGSGLLSLLGFNGERPDPVTACYLLGNGYRAFSPVLMRFNSPDNLSPFGKGGLNSYVYCFGDPINLYDPTGHFPAIGNLSRLIQGWFKRPSKLATSIKPTAKAKYTHTISNSTRAQVNKRNLLKDPNRNKSGPGITFKYETIRSTRSTHTLDNTVRPNGSWTDYTNLRPDPEGGYGVGYVSASGNADHQVANGITTLLPPRLSDLSYRQIPGSVLDDNITTARPRPVDRNTIRRNFYNSGQSFQAAMDGLVNGVPPSRFLDIIRGGA